MTPTLSCESQDDLNLGARKSNGQLDGIMTQLSHSTSLFVWTHIQAFQVLLLLVMSLNRVKLSRSNFTHKVISLFEFIFFVSKLFITLIYLQTWSSFLKNQEGIKDAKIKYLCFFIQSNLIKNLNFIILMSSYSYFSSYLALQII